MAASLTGRLVVDPDGERAELADFHVFHRYAANFPWTSHAVWLLAQMLRWGQLAAPVDLLAVARRVYRPDLYREAARAVGVPGTRRRPEDRRHARGRLAARWRRRGGRDGQRSVLRRPPVRPLRHRRLPGRRRASARHRSASRSSRHTIRSAADRGHHRSAPPARDDEPYSPCFSARCLVPAHLPIDEAPRCRGLRQRAPH